MAKKELAQNESRYSKGVDKWRISASPKVPPLELPIGQEVGELKPLIKADGIIVKLIIEDNVVYLVSPQTLQDIKDSDHPHYTSADNGKVLGSQIGKSIPIINLNASTLQPLSLQQDAENDKAGVKDALYTFEGDETEGVPNRLIEQINYTLVMDSQRPTDSFDLWNIQLDGNYSIERLVTETAQSGSKVDLEKLAKLMGGVNERVSILRQDFNVIKDVFYNGKIPPNSGFTTIDKLVEDDTVAKPADGTDDAEQVVFKFSTATDVVPTALTDGNGTPPSVPIPQPANDTQADDTSMAAVTERRKGLVGLVSGVGSKLKQEAANSSFFRKVIGRGGGRRSLRDAVTDFGNRNDAQKNT